MWEKINDFLEKYVENTIGFTLLCVVLVMVGFFCGLGFTTNFLYWLLGCLGGGLIITIFSSKE